MIQTISSYFHRVFNYCGVAIIFLSFFIMLGIIYFSTPGFISPHDPLYHVMQAYSYWTHVPLPLPLYSTLQEFKPDLYLYYHLLLAPFTLFFTGVNYNALIIGSKIFHLFFAALLFVVFYFIIRSFLITSKKYDIQTVRYISFFAPFFLFASSIFFVDRVVLPRPHLIAISLVLTSFYVIIRKKYIWLFFISFIFPGLYTISFITTLLVFLYGVAQWVYEKKFSVSSVYLFFVSIIGLLLGIFILPHPIAYIYNAYYVHLFTFFNAVTNSIFDASELSPYKLSFVDWIWLVPLLCVYGYYILRWIYYKKIKDTLSFELFFLACISFFLFIGLFLVSRAEEYFFPFAILLIILAFSTDIHHTLSAPNIVKGNTLYMFIHKKISPFYRENKKNIIRMLIFGTVLFCISNTVIAISQVHNLPAYDDYRNAAEYLKDHSEKKDIIFQESFDQYASLVLFNQYDQYSIGMSNTFLYVYNKEKFWLWEHSTHGDRYICGQRICKAEDNISTYAVIKDVFKAQYVILKDSVEDKQGTNESIRLQDRLKGDPHFILVFTDPRDSNIEIYKVL